jgi:hypothetical protein
MSNESKRPGGGYGQQPVEIQAGALGSTLLPSATRDRLVHPDATPLHEIPKDEVVEANLSRIENLLGKGHYGAALKEGGALTITEPLAGHYELIRREKTARAHLGIADQYFIRGDRARAREFYQRALQVDTADPVVKGFTETAVVVFDNLLNSRNRLIEGLLGSIQTSSFERWCGQKRNLGDVTILDVSQIRDRVVADYQLERVFG